MRERERGGGGKEERERGGELECAGGQVLRTGETERGNEGEERKKAGIREREGG